MNKRARNRPRPKPDRPRLSLRSRLAVSAILLLALGGGLWFALTASTPIPPMIATSVLDPASAQLIQGLMAGARNAPRSGAAWGKLGSALLQYEYKTEAEMAFAQAERFSPAEPRWPYLHGVLLLDGRAPAALLKFQAAAEMISDQPDMPRLRLAQLLLEQGRLESAEQHFQALLKLQPAHPLALLGMARIRLAQGHPAESTNFLAACLDDPHASKGAHALLARLEQELGHAQAAQTASRQSAGLPADLLWPDPYWKEALQYRVGKNAQLEEAEALLKQGNWREALSILTTITNNTPADGEAFYQIGWILNQQQQGGEAERVLREHLIRSPASPKGHAQLAVALLAQEHYAEAAGVLRRGLELAPAWSEMHFNLGYACARLGQSDEAIGHFRDALRHDPNYLDSYILLADLLNRRGQTEEAVKLLGQALVLNPLDTRAKTLLQRIR